VVWALARQEYWITLSPDFQEYDADQPALPFKRYDILPGTEDRLLVGRLSGSFKSNEVMLEPLSDTGFSHHNVVRLNGTIELV
jgi:hypothetical protein